MRYYEKPQHDKNATDIHTHDNNITRGDLGGVNENTPRNYTHSTQNTFAQNKHFHNTQRKRLGISELG
jgi:hypothetical protein